MPQVLPMTRVEAYLAYKAGVISEVDLKPSLKTNFYSGLEHWLAYWCGLCDDYPVDENNDPKWYTEEEYYVAYLCGIAPDYPYNCYRRVGAYLRHIISYRWPAPEKPLTREEYYLSLINSTTTSNPTPSSNFTLNDTTDGTFQGVEVYGDTTQNGEPTPDAPVDVNVVTGEQTVKVTGKNLFDKNNPNSTTGNIEVNGTLNLTGNNRTFFLKCEPNTTYTVQKRNDGDTNRFIVAWSELTPANGIPVYGRIQNYDAHSITITTGATAEYLIVTYYRNAETVLTEQQVIDSIQVELGSTATDYQPYRSQSYPLSLGSLELAKIGDYQDYIRKSTGKNLFDKDNANTLNAYFTTATTTITTATAGETETIVFIPCNPSTTYTVSKKAGTVFTIGTTDVLPVIGTQVNNIVGGNSATHLTVTTDPNSKFLVARVYRANTDTITQQEMLDSVQIELGPTATEYEPYGKVWYKHKAIEKIASYNGEDVPGDYISATGQLTTGATVYYALATPTDEEITDAALVAQLEALAAGQSYDPLTNFVVTATDPNLPALLKITAYKKQ